MSANKESTKKRLFVASLLIFLILGGFYLFFNRKESDNKKPNEPETQSDRALVNDDEESNTTDTTDDEDPQVNGEEDVQGDVESWHAESTEDSQVSQVSSQPAETAPPPREEATPPEPVGSPNFEYAGVQQTDFKKTFTGTLTTLNINLRGEGEPIKLVDLSNYTDQVLAFKWAAGSFEYGLTDKEIVPELEEVEISDDPPEGSSDLVSDLIPIHENSYLFIKPLESVDALSIQLIDPEGSSAGSLLVTANHSSGAKYSTLNIIPREQWSGDPNINDPRLKSEGGRLEWDPYYYKINKVVVHHTATANNEDPIYWMKAIYNYHAYTNGWGDIGYNYVIDQYGNIYEGKLGGEEAKGYHAGPGNANSIGVAIIGTYSDFAPSPAAQDALKKLIAEKAAFHNFTPQWHSTVYGHRDFMATACPGNAFYSILPSITSSASSYKNSHFSTIKSVVSKVNDEVDNSDHKANKLVVIFNNPSSISIPRIGTSGVDGIQDYKTDSSIVTLHIDYSSQGTQTTEERVKTLYKVFKLQGNVKSVGLIHKGELLKAQ